MPSNDSLMCKWQKRKSSSKRCTSGYFFLMKIKSHLHLGYRGSRILSGLRNEAEQCCSQAEERTEVIQQAWRTDRPLYNRRRSIEKTFFKDTTQSLFLWKFAILWHVRQSIYSLLRKKCTVQWKIKHDKVPYVCR